MKQLTSILAFNRGLVSRYGIARTDVKRIAISAETMTNYVPRVLGSMSLRPGLGYLGATASNSAARLVPFIFATDDTALLEFTNGSMRVWIDDALVTRGAVSTAVTNGNFDANLGSWTDADEVGGTSAWVTGGYMGLTGDGTAAAIRYQQVTVSAADQGDEHALSIVIERGPITLRVGSTLGGDEYITETVLGTGGHSLAFTPTGNFYIQFQSRLTRQVLVNSCNVAGSGVMSLTTPWLTADLGNIRADQSGDIVFAACAGYQQRMIERRGAHSWSVVLYQPEDGPFKIENSGPITLTASAINGNITLTASAALFRSTQVGGLYGITSEGQTVTKSVSAQNTFSNAIRITGVDSSRVFTIVISNTFVGTVTLQRSLTSDAGPWEDVSGKTWTTTTTETYDDGLDNQIVYYRIGIKTGDYVSGTADLTLQYNLGSITGFVRLTAYASSTSVSAEVLSDLGGTTATDVWAEGEWSDKNGWPTAVSFHEGRLWWAGQSAVWGSVSDAYDSFNFAVEGDAGTISRTLASGPVDTINWIASAKRLLVGAQGMEIAARSSSLDEPLTPTQFSLKTVGTQGSGSVSQVKVDTDVVFVDRTGIKIFQLAFDAKNYDYAPADLTQLVPELGSPGITRLAIQRKPDTRIHAVRSDGTVALGVFDKSEDVLCWCDVETDGEVEDVCTLPAESGDTDDQAYYIVKRTINGSVVRYLEKWAQSTECRGGALNKQADAFVVYDGSNLTHLEGEDVVVWVNGVDIGTTSTYTNTYTAVSGALSPASATAIGGIVGLLYTAQFKSTKLGSPTQNMSTILNQKKNVGSVGFVLADTHPKGVRFGPDFDTLDDMPGTEDGTAVDQDVVHTAYDEQAIEFPGTWDTDSRLCLQSQAPRPATILAATIDLSI